MIEFINLSKETPYKIFKEKYDDAWKANQSIIEAICISSYSSIKKEVGARFVNLKYVNEKEFIFFLITSLQSQKISFLMIKLLHFFIGAVLMFK